MVAINYVKSTFHRADKHFRQTMKLVRRSYSVDLGTDLLAVSEKGFGERGQATPRMMSHGQWLLLGTDKEGGGAATVMEVRGVN